MADKLLDKVQKLKERKELLSHVVSKLEYAWYAAEDKFEDEEDLVRRRDAIDFLTRICVDEISEIEEKFSKVREVIRTYEKEINEKKKNEENDTIIMEMIQKELKQFGFEMKLSYDYSDILCSLSRVKACSVDKCDACSMLREKCRELKMYNTDYYTDILVEGAKNYIEENLSEITSKIQDMCELFLFFMKVKIYFKVKITQDMVDKYNSIYPDLFLEDLLDKDEE